MSLECDFLSFNLWSKLWIVERSYLIKISQLKLKYNASISCNIVIAFIATQFEEDQLFEFKANIFVWPKKCIDKE